ncbi:hypothetical protein CR513_38846, partial [Mucuna pruriens]
MHQDCRRYVLDCQECQAHGHVDHSIAKELYFVTSPWPFSIWGWTSWACSPQPRDNGLLHQMDQDRAISHHHHQKFELLIWKNFICKYRLPHSMMTNNDTQFELDINHKVSSVKTPNKTNMLKLPIRSYSANCGSNSVEQRGHGPSSYQASSTHTTTSPQTITSETPF